ncbi:MAG: hypothetical protein KGR26_05955 [Cyanobacteria bacterium REEB65]|nr:hypothetical protein [Cyanobacteria bacterium REEB65]
MADNPFAHWFDVRSFRMHEAALLLCDLEPAVNGVEQNPRSYAVLKRMLEDFFDHRLAATEDYLFNDAERVKVWGADYQGLILERAEVVRWAAEHVVAAHFLAPDLADVATGTAAAAPLTDAKKASTRGQLPLDSKWISNAEAAALVGNKPETLNTWRKDGWPPMPKTHYHGMYAMFDRVEWEAFAARYLAREFSRKRKR